jgi:hypothetical protein
MTDHINELIERELKLNHRRELAFENICREVEYEIPSMELIREWIQQFNDVGFILHNDEWPGNLSFFITHTIQLYNKKCF